MKGGTGRTPQAFAVHEQMYLRQSSPSLLSDTVHEGTHALDRMHGFLGTTHQRGKRAYFYERQFQKASGGYVDFDSIGDMLHFVYDNY